MNTDLVDQLFGIYVLILTLPFPAIDPDVAPNLVSPLSSSRPGFSIIEGLSPFFLFCFVSCFLLEPKTCKLIPAVSSVNTLLKPSSSAFQLVTLVRVSDRDRTGDLQGHNLAL